MMRSIKFVFLGGVVEGFGMVERLTGSSVPGELKKKSEDAFSDDEWVNVGHSDVENEVASKSTVQSNETHIQRGSTDVQTDMQKGRHENSQQGDTPSWHDDQPVFTVFHASGDDRDPHHGNFDDGKQPASPSTASTASPTNTYITGSPNNMQSVPSTPSMSDIMSPVSGSKKLLFSLQEAAGEDIQNTTHEHQRKDVMATTHDGQQQRQDAEVSSGHGSDSENWLMIPDPREKKLKKNAQQTKEQEKLEAAEARTKTVLKRTSMEVVDSKHEETSVKTRRVEQMSSIVQQVNAQEPNVEAPTGEAITEAQIRPTEDAQTSMAKQITSLGQTSVATLNSGDTELPDARTWKEVLMCTRRGPGGGSTGSNVSSTLSTSRKSSVLSCDSHCERHADSEKSAAKAENLDAICSGLRSMGAGTELGTAVDVQRPIDHGLLNPIVHVQHDVVNPVTHVTASAAAASEAPAAERGATSALSVGRGLHAGAASPHGTSPRSTTSTILSLQKPAEERADSDVSQNDSSIAGNDVADSQAGNQEGESQDMEVDADPLDVETSKTAESSKTQEMESRPPQIQRPTLEEMGAYVPEAERVATVSPAQLSGNHFAGTQLMDSSHNIQSDGSPVVSSHSSQAFQILPTEAMIAERLQDADHGSGTVTTDSEPQSETLHVWEQFAKNLLVQQGLLDKPFQLLKATDDQGDRLAGKLPAGGDGAEQGGAERDLLTHQLSKEQQHLINQKIDQEIEAEHLAALEAAELGSRSPSPASQTKSRKGGRGQRRRRKGGRGSDDSASVAYYDAYEGKADSKGSEKTVSTGSRGSGCAWKIPRGNYLGPFLLILMPNLCSILDSDVGKSLVTHLAFESAFSGTGRCSSGSSSTSRPTTTRQHPYSSNYQWTAALEDFLRRNQRADTVSDFLCRGKSSHLFGILPQIMQNAGPAGPVAGARTVLPVDFENKTPQDKTSQGILERTRKPAYDECPTYCSDHISEEVQRLNDANLNLSGDSLSGIFPQDQSRLQILSHNQERGLVSPTESSRMSPDLRLPFGNFSKKPKPESCPLAHDPEQIRRFLISMQDRHRTQCIVPRSGNSSRRSIPPQIGLQQVGDVNALRDQDVEMKDATDQLQCLAKNYCNASDAPEKKGGFQPALHINTQVLHMHEAGKDFIPTPRSGRQQCFAGDILIRQSCQNESRMDQYQPDYVRAQQEAMQVDMGNGQYCSARDAHPSLSQTPVQQQGFHINTQGLHMHEAGKEFVPTPRATIKETDGFQPQSFHQAVAQAMETNESCVPLPIQYCSLSQCPVQQGSQQSVQQVPRQSPQQVPQQCQQVPDQFCRPGDVLIPRGKVDEVEIQYGRSTIEKGDMDGMRVEDDALFEQSTWEGPFQGEYNGSRELMTLNGTSLSAADPNGTGKTRASGCNDVDCNASGMRHESTPDIYDPNIGVDTLSSPDDLEAFRDIEFAVICDIADEAFFAQALLRNRGLMPTGDPQKFLEELIRSVGCTVTYFEPRSTLRNDEQCPRQAALRDQQTLFEHDVEGVLFAEHDKREVGVCESPEQSMDFRNAHSTVFEQRHPNGSGAIELERYGGHGQFCDAAAYDTFFSSQQQAISSSQAASSFRVAPSPNNQVASSPHYPVDRTQMMQHVLGSPRIPDCTLQMLQMDANGSADRLEQLAVANSQAVSQAVANVPALAVAMPGMSTPSPIKHGLGQPPRAQQGLGTPPLVPRSGDVRPSGQDLARVAGQRRGLTPEHMMQVSKFELSPALVEGRALSLSNWSRSTAKISLSDLKKLALAAPTLSVVPFSREPLANRHVRMGPLGDPHTISGMGSSSLAVMEHQRMGPRSLAVMGQQSLGQSSGDPRISNMIATLAAAKPEHSPSPRVALMPSIGGVSNWSRVRTVSGMENLKFNWPIQKQTPGVTPVGISFTGPPVPVGAPQTPVEVPAAQQTPEVVVARQLTPIITQPRMYAPRKHSGIGSIPAKDKISMGSNMSKEPVPALSLSERSSSIPFHDVAPKRAASHIMAKAAALVASDSAPQAELTAAAHLLQAQQVAPEVQGSLPQGFFGLVPRDLPGPSAGSLQNNSAKKFEPTGRLGANIGLNPREMQNLLPSATVQPPMGTRGGMFPPDASRPGLRPNELDAGGPVRARIDKRPGQAANQSELQNAEYETTLGHAKYETGLQKDTAQSVAALPEAAQSEANPSVITLSESAQNKKHEDAVWESRINLDTPDADSLSVGYGLSGRPLEWSSVVGATPESQLQRTGLITDIIQARQLDNPRLITPVDSNIIIPRFQHTWERVASNHPREPRDGVIGRDMKPVYHPRGVEEQQKWAADLDILVQQHYEAEDREKEALLEQAANEMQQRKEATLATRSLPPPIVQWKISDIEPVLDIQKRVLDSKRALLVRNARESSRIPGADSSRYTHSQAGMDDTTVAGLSNRHDTRAVPAEQKPAKQQPAEQRFLRRGRVVYTEMD